MNLSHADDKAKTTVSTVELTKRIKNDSPAIVTVLRRKSSPPKPDKKNVTTITYPKIMKSAGSPEPAGRVRTKALPSPSIDTNLHCEKTDSNVIRSTRGSPEIRGNQGSLVKNSAPKFWESTMSSQPANNKIISRDDVSIRKVKTPPKTAAKTNCPLTVNNSCAIRKVWMPPGTVRSEKTPELRTPTPRGKDLTAQLVVSEVGALQITQCPPPITPKNCHKDQSPSILATDGKLEISANDLNVAKSILIPPNADRSDGVSALMTSEEIMDDKCLTITPYCTPINTPERCCKDQNAPVLAANNSIVAQSVRAHPDPDSSGRENALITSCEESKESNCLIITPYRTPIPTPERSHKKQNNPSVLATNGIPQLSANDSSVVMSESILPKPDSSGRESIVIRNEKITETNCLPVTPYCTPTPTKEMCCKEPRLPALATNGNRQSSANDSIVAKSVWIPPNPDSSGRESALMTNEEIMAAKFHSEGNFVNNISSPTDMTYLCVAETTRISPRFATGIRRSPVARTFNKEKTESSLSPLNSVKDEHVELIQIINSPKQVESGRKPTLSSGDLSQKTPQLPASIKMETSFPRIQPDLNIASVSDLDEVAIIDNQYFSDRIKDALPELAWSSRQAYNAHFDQTQESGSPSDSSTVIISLQEVGNSSDKNFTELVNKRNEQVCSLPNIHKESPAPNM